MESALGSAVFGVDDEDGDEDEDCGLAATTLESLEDGFLGTSFSPGRETRLPVEPRRLLRLRPLPRNLDTENSVDIWRDEISAMCESMLEVAGEGGRVETYYVAAGEPSGV